MKEDVRAVWEISEELEAYLDGNPLVLGGGRREELKTRWEEVYEAVLNRIC